VASSTNTSRTYSLDADSPALAVSLKYHSAGYPGKESMVTALAAILPRPEFIAALAHQNAPGLNYFPAEGLNAQTLARAIPAVSGTTLTFSMSHNSSSPSSKACYAQPSPPLEAYLRSLPLYAYICNLYFGKFGSKAFFSFIFFSTLITKRNELFPLEVTYYLTLNFYFIEIWSAHFYLPVLG
jgi:hypothetical protein